MSFQPPNLVLASQSSTRQKILTTILDVPFVVHAPCIDESLHPKESAQQAVLRLAKQKLLKVGVLFPEHFIIAADTMGICHHHILGKPNDAKEAQDHLTHLSGRTHKILTAVYVQNPQQRISWRLICSKVKFKKLSKEDIKTYIESKDWQGKACSYSLDGAGQKFIITMSGSPSAAMGLPAYETLHLLKGLGLK